MPLNDRIAAWIQAQIDEQAPALDLDAEGIRRRLGALRELLDVLEGTNPATQLFGMSLQGDTLIEARARFVASARASRTAWHDHLTQVDEPTKRVAREYGYVFVGDAPQPRRPPTRSLEVDAALDRLLAILDRGATVDGKPVAYWLDETPAHVFTENGAPPPSQLEGIYARLDGLAIYTAKKGGRSAKLRYDWLEIERADDAEELEVEGRSFITLHKHDGGRLLLCALDDGSVWKIAWHGEAPERVAPAIAAYLDQLSARYSA